MSVTMMEPTTSMPPDPRPWNYLMDARSASESLYIGKFARLTTLATINHATLCAVAQNTLAIVNKAIEKTKHGFLPNTLDMVPYSGWLTA